MEGWPGRKSKAVCRSSSNPSTNSEHVESYVLSSERMGFEYFRRRDLTHHRCCETESRLGGSPPRSQDARKAQGKIVEMVAGRIGTEIIRHHVGLRHSPYCALMHWIAAAKNISTVGWLGLPLLSR